MDIYLLQIIGNWLSMLAVSFISLFGLTAQDKNIITQENTNYTKATTVISEVVPYQVEYVYNYNIPSTDEPSILTKGVTGINYTYENGTTKTIVEPVTEVVEIGMAQATTYTGKLTGYGPDCAGCSGAGNLSCKLPTGGKYSLVQNGVTYFDNQYGELRILAADTSVFPCGSVIMVDNGKLEPFMGIVLDTGYSVKNATLNGTIWMDLAYATEKDPAISLSTSSNTTYTVKRLGW